jgi:hypothetical protein
MAGPGNILIRIGASAGQAITEIESVNGAMATTATRSERMAAGLKKAAVPAAIALGAIAYGAKKAVDAAGDLEKQVGKTNKVFGDNATAVVEWSKDLAESFGLSSDEALKAAGRFGNLFQNLGYSAKASSGMSEQMVQLAADLASFNNVPVDATLSALQSGLSGATRGLKKYGIVIDSTALKQEAARQGLYSGTGALSAHAKAAATMTLILQQTANAQGDFAKNSGTAANQTKVQAAETQNLSEELGTALLPYYEAGQKLLIAFTGAMSDHTGAVKVAIGVVAGLSAAILIANAAIKAYTVAQTVARVATIVATAAWRALNIAMVSNPIGVVIVALVALGAALVIAYKHSETFRNIVNSALNGVLVAARALAHGFEAVGSAAAVAFDWIVAHWRIGALALGPLGVGIIALVDHFNAVRNAALSAFNAILGAIRPVIDAVEKLIGLLGSIHVPKISLPHIPGLHSTLIAAPAAAGGLSRSVDAGGRASVGGAGITVNFFGPTDPEGAARAISRVLRRHEVRQGRLA